MTQTIQKKKKGFTLIELIVVIAILAILAAILVPSMLGYINDSKSSVAAANARSVYSAASSAYTSIASKGTAPASGTDATYLAKVSQNLGSAFKGTYTITLSTDGVSKVEYTSEDGNTTATYPETATTAAD